MRGSPDRQLAMVVLSSGDLIPSGHPIRKIRRVVDDVLALMDVEFTAMYAKTGRPSVPPEALLKSSVLMALYSMRSERAFCERLNYDMLFKWFLDMPIDAKAFDATTFTKNRERLLAHEIASRFFSLVVEQARLRRYVSSDHFSVDGTLLEAWASHKSFRPKDQQDDNAVGQPDTAGDPSGEPDQRRGRNAEHDFRGERRSNVTHESTTDPEARMARKSNATAAKLCYAGHLLMENRNGLIVDMEFTHATGYAEREAAVAMLTRLPTRARRRTVAADKAYDVASFVTDVRKLGVTPHVAQNTKGRRSGIDGRTTRHAGHQVSLRIRKRIEEPFGWMKTVAGGRKLRYTGQQRNRSWFLMTGAVYNIIRITKLDTI